VRDVEETEFADFFAATWARLFRTALALTGDRGQAEDAVQSAFAKAYASWQRVRRTEHPEAYVRRMAVNEVLAVRRAEDDLVADRTDLWEALMSLPPRQRAVLVLRYYEDLSEQEIADVLGCSRGTVKSQASDALSTLRRRKAAGAVTNEGDLSWNSTTS
jgi:RNA polymerase sigma-70 factor (sigma-E family)